MSKGAAHKAKAASQNSPNTLEQRIGILRSRFSFVAPFLWIILFQIIRSAPEAFARQLRSTQPSS
jgi:hypothetical protein